MVGGGITGLTTAYRLTQIANRQAQPFDVLLLEASGRLGGVIGTMQQDGLLLEQGPDCFLAAKPWGVRLCEELGLQDELISTTTQHRQSFIVRAGRLLPVPQGFYLMAPGSWRSFLTTPIFSWPGKLRMALDLVLPRRTDPRDESLAQFVTRRLGREALERMAQPMVGGIYTADPQYLSMRATMPQFLDMEQQHGSVIRALLRRQPQTHPTAQGTSGARYGLFVSLRRGIQTLVDTLLERLPPETVRLHTPVQHVQRLPETGRWVVHLAEQPGLEADAVCLCLPAPQAGQMLHAVDATLAAGLQAMRYASSATVNIVCRRDQIAHPLDGIGFVVPAIEQRSLIACSFSSVKFAGRAPQGQVLLRAFVGGALHPQQLACSDAAMQQAVLQDLRTLLGMTGEPLSMRTARHLEAMPQYHVGHLERVAHLQTLLAAWPGLVLAGNAYHGVGIPDCIHDAERAAETVLSTLASSL
ncbi:MAG: protoporphyrinogen oxidase [Candidatus Tectomicrobia bacterium]|uniref:Coproporphyrinogen III oxidase n=1 Tax=Tectimicrobiota bacterium TaxID=2528274 RepID=A0A937VWG3_UNCTE|nr:protoporphyrinogen oxidase [Candidatus Tectomicrobia bacterium]